jgi:hypothetical protein
VLHGKEDRAADPVSTDLTRCQPDHRGGTRP